MVLRYDAGSGMISDVDGGKVNVSHSYIDILRVVVCEIYPPIFVPFSPRFRFRVVQCAHDDIQDCFVRGYRGHQVPSLCNPRNIVARCYVTTNHKDATVQACRALSSIRSE
jgi:hypothetical protein